MAEPATRAEPFPPLVPENQNSFTSPGTPSTTRRPSDLATRDRRASRSSLGGSIRRLSRQFGESSPPEGFLSQTGNYASSMISLDEAHRTRRAQSLGKTPGIPLAPILSSNVPESNTVVSTPQQHVDVIRNSEGQAADKERTSIINKIETERSANTTLTELAPGAETADTEPFDNGYHFPPKHTTGEATKQFFIASWKFCSTFWGFFWFVYGLNVVAWGGMLFLLLCNASPAMCYPTCDDIDSPRRVWIEIDSQILNALFCVTGFGLAPWRFRDLYYLLKYRLLHQEDAWRRLAGLKRGWFRLEASEVLPLNVGPGNIPDDTPVSSIPLPAEKIPDPPLTGVRAPPTAPWKMDFFIWCMIWNTFFQTVLSGFMWGMNRYDRPSWSTGLFVALGCIIAAVGGIVTFIEGKKVKSIEGVPLTDQDREKLALDREKGIPHFNNIKDKKPKEKAADEEANTEKPSKAKKILGVGSNDE